MMEFARDLASHVSHAGCATAEYAKRIGGGTADVAKRVGPARGLIGLAVLGAAITGGIFLVRYLRARAEREHAGEEPMRRKTKLAH